MNIFVISNKELKRQIVSSDVGPHPNLPIIPQTKNPTDVGLDVVERVNLLQQYHLLGLRELSCLNGVQVKPC